MRLAFLAAFALAACGNPAPHAELPPPRTDAPPVWFICDGIDAPTAFVFADAPDDRRTRVLQLDKTNGQIVFDGEVALGDQEGAAGSIYTQLLIDGAEAGSVRQINPGMLETPGSAYTAPFTSVSFRGLNVSCRWMPRTRALGLTDRRSFVIYEDQSGDLIYTTYDFSAAAQQTPIDLAQNGRSTPFSAEVREGEENLGADGVSFTFNARDNIRYVAVLGRDGQGRLDVQSSGETVQSEPLIAFQLGAAEE